MEIQKIKLVVVNENTLGYINPETNNLTVFRASVIKGKSSRFFSYDNDVFQLNNNDKVRLASAKDFENYRCSFEGYTSDEYEFAA